MVVRLALVEAAAMESLGKLPAFLNSYSSLSVAICSGLDCFDRTVKGDLVVQKSQFEELAGP